MIISSCKKRELISKGVKKKKINFIQIGIKKTICSANDKVLILNYLETLM